MEEVERMVELKAEMVEAWNQVMDYDALQIYQRDCDDDIFFEDIIVFSSKAALRVQRLVKQAENLDRQNTLKNLRILKNNGFSENFDEIQVLENRLNQLEERINSDKVINYLKTTILNDEKITPQFLRLAETLHKDSLEKICKDNGEPFT